MNSETVNTVDARQGIDQTPVTKDPPRYAWILVCLLMLSVTWLPVLAIHLSRTSLSAEDAGAVVVIFSPRMKRENLFRNIIEASGSIVRPVSWFPGMWIALSRESGFAGRLMQAGAWGVYSPDLLDARALLDCMTIEPLAETGSTLPAS